MQTNFSFFQCLTTQNHEFMLTIVYVLFIISLGVFCVSKSFHFNKNVNYALFMFKFLLYTIL